MDMIARRAVLMGMANVNNHIKGTFTPDSTVLFTIDFGKTLSRYILFIEMTDDSITDLVNAGETSNKSYTLMTAYGVKSVDGISPGTSSLNVRYNGSSIGYASASTWTLTGSSFSAYPAAITASAANTLYVGYTYNYTVIPID